MTKNNTYICIFLVMLLPVIGGYMKVSAQTHIRGRVVDESLKPVVGASVVLMDKSDSSTVSGCAADSSGLFALDAKGGQYIMKVSCIGYKSHEAQVNCYEDISIPNIILKPESQHIDGVTVTAKRVTYNSKGYSYNLLNEPLLRDNTLMETLTLMPGLSMKEGRLTAYQQEILSVFINNKKLRLPMSDILHMLSTYESKNIRTVEVLNSTADPEESTRMGFVLKITTKTADDGGNLTTGISDKVGNTYDNAFVPWFSLQQRTGNWSFYLSPRITPTSVMKRNKHTFTNYYDTGREREEFEMWTLKTNPTAMGTTSMAYDFNANHSLMLSASGEYKKQAHRSATDNIIVENGSTTQTNGITTRASDTKQANIAIDYNGTLGKVTIISAASYSLQNTETKNNHSQKKEVITAAEDINDDVRFHLAILRSTAVWDMGEGQSTTFGVSYVRWNNKTETKSTLHTSQYTTFEYDENKFSASTQYQLNKRLFSMNVGVEFYHNRQSPKMTEGAQFQKVVRNYTYLLPTVTLTLTASKKKNVFFTLRYGRDYDMPGINQYNSNAHFTSEYSYEKGLLDIEPGRTDQVRMQANLSGWAVYAIGSFATSPTYIYGVDDSGMEYRSYDNNAKNTMLYTGVSSPQIQLCKEWALTASTYYQWNRDSYLQRVSHGNRIGMDFTSTNKLPYDITMTIRGNLMTRYYTLYSRLKNPGDINATLNRSWMKGRLITQIMLSYSFRQGALFLTDYYQQFSRYTKPVCDVVFALRYQFGWGNRLARAKHRMGIESELLRMSK